VIHIALRGGRRVKVIKIQMRLAKLSNGLTIDRDVIGAINIGLRYPSRDRKGMARSSTEPHGVLVKLLIPHQGLTLLTELKIP
jgi:transposase